MSFPNIASTRRPLRILDHMVLIAVAALPLAAFLPTTGAAARPPQAANAVGLSVAMLALGYFLWLLPGLGIREPRRWFALLVLPAFISLALIYLVLAFLTFFCDPNAAAMIVVAQLMALVYVSVRS
jgi:hypothetical protein